MSTVDPFFIFNLHFIIINHIISSKQDAVVFAHFLKWLLFLDNNMDDENEFSSR